MFSLKIGAGGLISRTVPLMQVWPFVAPDSTRKKKLAVPFVMVSSSSSGANVRSPTIAFPMMWSSSSYELYGVKWLPTLDTLSFYVKLIRRLLGVPDAAARVRAREVRARDGRPRPQVQVGDLIIFIVAALIGRRPVCSQCVFAAPMLALYAISIVVAWMFGKKKKTEDED
jgi:sec-independent protein translocase protein TatC